MADAFAVWAIFRSKQWSVVATKANTTWWGLAKLVHGGQISKFDITQEVVMEENVVG